MMKLPVSVSIPSLSLVALVLILSGCAKKPIVENEGSAVPNNRALAVPTSNKGTVELAPKQDAETAEVVSKPDSDAVQATATEVSNEAEEKTNRLAEKAQGDNAPQVDEVAVAESGAIEASGEQVGVQAEATPEAADSLVTRVEDQTARAETEPDAELAATDPSVVPGSTPEPQSVLESQEQAEAAPLSADELVASLAPQQAAQPSRSGPRLNLSDLPARFEVWELVEGKTDQGKGLTITTPTWQMGEPGYHSQIRVVVMDDQVFVYSSSDFFEDTAAVKIDGGEAIKFIEVINNHIGVLDAALLEPLRAGSNLEITMAFFPDKRPRSKLFTSEVSLNGLDDALYHYNYLK